MAGDPATSMRVVGVTGSNGKTTTSALVRAILDHRAAPGDRCGSISTVGAVVREQTRQTTLTTPEAPEVHRLLAWMTAQGAASAVVEASSIALDVGRLDGVAFDVAVFTGFEEDHLDHHGTVEQYWASKAQMFRPGRSAGAVVVTDDPWGRRLADQLTIPAVRVGHEADTDVRILDWHTGEDGTDVWLAAEGQRHHVRASVIGQVNVTNIAAAWATGRHLGLSPDHVAAGLAAATASEGRNTLVESAGGPLVIVDYAHTPRALDAAIESARQLRPTGNVHLVLGARGARDRYKRQGLGRAARAADHVWLTNEGSHGENPQAIIEELRVGLIGADAAVRVVLDRPAAVTAAVHAARTFDVVLITGRGHETLIQDVAGALRPDRAVAFSDVEGARAALLTRVRTGG